MLAESHITPGFMIIQGNRLEDLREVAVRWLERNPLAPLENEVILVQSNGIAQWLKLSLAANRAEVGGGCGIAAALDIMLPARLQWKVYRALLGNLPQDSLFDKQCLTWRLMRLLEKLPVNDGIFLPVSRFLDADTALRKRYQLSEKLADLFDQYQVYRADWLEDWAAGRDLLRKPDGSTEPVPPEQRWQPALWRMILADLPEVARDTSRASVHQRFLAATKTINESNRLVNIPRRVVVFGISSLPQQMLDVLAAIAPFTQVLLCVHNPCQYYWGDIVEGRELFQSIYKRSKAPQKLQNFNEEEWHLHGHPLLAAWGKQGRDYIRLLDLHDQHENYEKLFSDNNLKLDLFVEPEGKQCLQQLQGDILSLRSLAERKNNPDILHKDDDSIVLHVAHSEQREVEILHDQLLDAFSKDKTLRPRDVMVMVPDINKYAPHILAVFGQLDRHDPRYIPFTIADQGQRAQKPLLLALDSLLHVEQSRFTVSELQDWFDVPAIRVRAGITESQLPTLRRWVRGAQIRWGLHATQREKLGLPAEIEQNSWHFGLQRMLLGYATGNSDAWQGIEPYDEIGGLEAALAGNLLDFIQRLEMYWKMLTLPASPIEWVKRLRELLDHFFAAQEQDDALLLEKLDTQLENWLVLCAAADFSEPLPLNVVRDMWLAGMEQPHLSQRFLAGAVNFATMMPMRVIPFKRICLLGMNDADFPRRQPATDFDLMAKRYHYRPGDRSRRDDDRYLFLEALLSAREQLYISWVGRSIRDNSERPPSVLVSQLKDHIVAGWGNAPFTIEHPLQPFSRQYFTDSALFTYASEWLEVHQDKIISKEEIFSDTSADEKMQDGQITLNNLGDFLRNPVEYFFKRTMKVSMRNEALATKDIEPFVFDGLERWEILDTLLQPLAAALRKNPSVCCDGLLKSGIEKLQAQGMFPLPPFNRFIEQELNAALQKQLMQYAGCLQDAVPVEPVDVQGNFSSLLVQDRIEQLYEKNGKRFRLVLLTSALGEGKDLKYYHLVREWPAHLALQFSGSGQSIETVIVHGGKNIITLPALEKNMAESCFDDLLAAYTHGIQEPLPAPCKTAFALFIENPHQPDTSAEYKVEKSEEAYNGGYHFTGEAEDSPLLARCWPDFHALKNTQQFEHWAEKIYRPLYVLLNGEDVSV
jgi:exodeoxyribonuclease V gamma subunit